MRIRITSTWNLLAFQAGFYSGMLLCTSNVMTWRTKEQLAYNDQFVVVTWYSMVKHEVSISTQERPRICFSHRKLLLAEESMSLLHCGSLTEDYKRLHTASLTAAHTSNTIDYPG